MAEPTILVVSAHAADFVWRASGTMALYVQRGSRVRLLVLSFGERGESGELWKQPGQTIDNVKAIRRHEAQAAADVIGADVRFFDIGDYPLGVTEQLMDELIQEFRSLQPEYVLTHPPRDPYNMDHEKAAEITLQARVLAQAPGVRPDLPIIGTPPVFGFEPHQPEQCDFKPNVFIDITESFDKKLAAMNCVQTQKHLIEYYSQLAWRRGVQAARNAETRATYDSGIRKIKYAEAFQSYYPYVGRRFP